MDNNEFGAGSPPESNGPMPLSGGAKVLFFLLVIFIPFIGPLVGIILGIVYLNNEIKENRSFGKSILITSIVMLVLMCLCCVVVYFGGIASLFWMEEFLPPEFWDQIPQQ